MSEFVRFENLIDHLATLKEHEMAQLCDALVDDPRLRDLIEMIDAYLYLSNEDVPPLNLINANLADRELN